ncbi:MAG: ATP-binding protein [Miltoncostaeaceae bacterium]
MPAAPDLPLDAHAFEVRVALHRVATEPPDIRVLRAGDAAALIEAVVDTAAPHTRVAPLALREIVENLVHAQFMDPLVSVVGSGTVVRVSDRGPGIPDLERARRAGFTTAGPEERTVIRGVGAGLALAAELLSSDGGGLDIEENLGSGVVVTLSVPAAAGPPDEPSAPSEDQRALLALLLELAEADAASLASESGLPLAVCGRELAVLEHRGLLVRGSSARRSLTGPGRELISSLF